MSAVSARWRRGGEGWLEICKMGVESAFVRDATWQMDPSSLHSVKVSGRIAGHVTGYIVLHITKIARGQSELKSVRRALAKPQAEDGPVADVRVDHAASSSCSCLALSAPLSLSSPFPARLWRTSPPPVPSSDFNKPSPLAAADCSTAASSLLCTSSVSIHQKRGWKT